MIDPSTREISWAPSSVSARRVAAAGSGSLSTIARTVPARSASSGRAGPSESVRTPPTMISSAVERTLSTNDHSGSVDSQEASRNCRPSPGSTTDASSVPSSACGASSPVSAVYAEASRESSSADAVTVTWARGCSSV